MSTLSGIVVAVSVSAAKGTPKTNVDSVVLVADCGIEGDAHAGSGHRQVSLLSLESIETMRRMGADVGPGDFAENITVVGLDLTAVTIGVNLSIGAVQLVVTQLGKECHSRCAVFDAVGDCVMPREGIFARVLKGGKIRPGDPVNVITGVDTASADLPSQP